LCFNKWCFLPHLTFYNYFFHFLQFLYLLFPLFTLTFPTFTLTFCTNFYTYFFTILHFFTIWIFNFMQIKNIFIYLILVMGTWGHGYMGSWDHFLISLISSSSLLHRLHYFIVFIDLFFPINFTYFVIFISIFLNILSSKKFKYFCTVIFIIW